MRQESNKFIKKLKEQLVTLAFVHVLEESNLKYYRIYKKSFKRQLKKLSPESLQEIENEINGWKELFEQKEKELKDEKYTGGVH